MPTRYHSALVIYMCSIKYIITIISYECLVEETYKHIQWTKDIKSMKIWLIVLISNLTKHSLVFLGTDILINLDSNFLSF